MSIIRLFVALPEFPYLGYKAARSQGTKLNPLWKGALYIYMYIYIYSFIFCFRRYSFAIKKLREREKSIFIEIDSNLPTPHPAPCYEDGTQSETVNKLKVRTVNSPFTKSAIFWNFSFVVKLSVSEIPHFVINVVSANKRQKAIGSKS